MVRCWAGVLPLALMHVACAHDATNQPPGSFLPEQSGFVLTPLTAEPDDKMPAEIEPTDADLKLSLAGEWEPVDRVVLGWSEESDDLAPFFGAITQAALEQSAVTVLVPSTVRPRRVSRLLRSVGVSVDYVDYEVAPVDTMWIRDYGPLILRNAWGEREIVDLPYAEDRPQDDQVPRVLAATWQLPLKDMPLDLEGGHLLADGTGRCVITDDVLIRDADTHSWGEIQDLFEENLGCSKLVVVPALEGEPTGHLDMFAYITGPGHVLVGSYTEKDDARNAQVLDQAAQILTEARFHVTRIPMPRNDSRKIFRTYTNALIVNRIVFVPVYKADTRHQQEALDIFQRAFPKRTIVPVASDQIAELSGAVHCAAITLPE